MLYYNIVVVGLLCVLDVVAAGVEGGIQLPGNTRLIRLVGARYQTSGFKIGYVQNGIWAKPPPFRELYLVLVHDFEGKYRWVFVLGQDIGGKSHWCWCW